MVTKNRKMVETMAREIEVAKICTWQKLMVKIEI